MMSPSWNFPARAEPSYEGSEPSRAELGHFNFRAETELDFFDISNSKVFGTQKKTYQWKLEEFLLHEFLKRGFLKSKVPFFHSTEKFF